MDKRRNMKQLAINYRLRDDRCDHDVISSRIFVLKSEGEEKKYTYIEAFSFQFTLRKKLSLKILNYLLRHTNNYTGIDTYSFYFSDLEKVRKKLGIYMPDDTLNCVCDWVKNEIG